MTQIERFRQLHAEGFFVMPNAWDAGSARRLQDLGFTAIGSTSAGFAASLGRRDQETSFDELCAHVEALTGAVDIPVSVDAERLFADSGAEIARHVEALAERGAAGVSIEDYDPATGRIESVGVAADRVRAAASAAERAGGLVVTARAENHLYAVGDLEDTIERLQRYAAAGADVVYAPGLESASEIAAVVAAVDVPVNVLLRPNGPNVEELASLGVRRASTGSRLAVVAYDAMTEHASSLLR